jgi:hypothetical protein
MYVFTQGYLKYSAHHIGSALIGLTVRIFRQDMEIITTHLEKHRKDVQVHVDHAERMANKESRSRLEAKILSDEKRASEITFCKDDVGFNSRQF